MYKFLLGLATILCCVSCNKGKSYQTDAGLSTQAKQILMRVDTFTRYGQNAQAMVYLDSAYQTIKSPNTKELYERLNAKFIYYHLTEEDAVKTNLYADSMLSLLNDGHHQYKLEYTNALFAKGDALLMNKHYNLAFNYYYQAQRFGAKNLDKCQAYRFTYRLGQFRYKQERYLEALYFMKHAYNEGKTCDQALYDTYLWRHSFLNTIGVCYEKLGKLDSAVVYYQKSLQYIEKYPEMYRLKKSYMLTSQGVMYGNIGGVYLKLGHFSQAEQYLKKSIAINDKPRYDRLDALTAKIKLADLYYRVNRLKAANTLLKKMRLDLQKLKVPMDIQLRLYKLEWQYFDKIKDIPKAYQHLELYHNMQDSMNHANQAIKASDIDMSFKNNEQEYQLNTLNKEKDVQGNYLVTFVILFILITFTLFILWYKKRELKVLNIQITEQNTSMQNVLTALEQSQRENMRMMQIVAHDLRSPLAAAISITGLLKSADLTPDEHKMLNLLETSSSHSLDLIADLLNINTNAVDMKTESVELQSLITYCIDLLQFKATEKAQNLIFSGINVNIRANSGKIWRVVSNLIVNAIKFSPIGADIEIEMFKADEEIVIKIKDYGIGIPIDHKEKIFDIFTDTKRKGTSGEHSFGIGLAISKQIVEAHKGDIWFESKVNEGSTFYVSLPI